MPADAFVSMPEAEAKPQSSPGRGSATRWWARQIACFFGTLLLLQVSIVLFAKWRYTDAQIRLLPAIGARWLTTVAQREGIADFLAEAWEGEAADPAAARASRALQALAPAGDLETVTTCGEMRMGWQCGTSAGPYKSNDFPVTSLGATSSSQACIDLCRGTGWADQPQGCCGRKEDGSCWFIPRGEVQVICCGLNEYTAGLCDRKTRRKPAPSVPKVPMVTAAPAPLPTVRLTTAAPGQLPAVIDGSKQLTTTSSLFEVPRDELRVFGHSVPSNVMLCVAFGTVPRKKDYVFDTISTMLGLRVQEGGSGPVSTPSEQKLVVTVAHLADFNMTWVMHMSKRLQNDYPGLIAEGLFHGIHAPEERYPPLDFCPPFCTYKDDPHRVRWRAKQNIDYAFMMYYSAPLAPYFLQLEDDITFSMGWVSKVLQYIGRAYPATFLSKNENVPWRMISFSQLGFIGKCFQANELTRMAQFLLLYYDQMPCDLLLGNWMESMGQKKAVDYWKRMPSLFQHIGLFRSLGGFQPLQEKHFGSLLFDNPPGVITWTYEIVPTYEGKFIYEIGGSQEKRNDVCDFKQSPKAFKSKTKRCWFWAKNPQVGQHLTIVFNEAINLKAFFVEFGHALHKDDLLQNGTVQVADNHPGMPLRVDRQENYCGPFVELIEFNGEKMVYWEMKISGELPVARVRCVRILAKRNQATWAIIMQLQVRSK